MKNLFSLISRLLNWGLMLLIIPDLVISFAIPLWFDDPNFWEKKALVWIMIFCFTYPFITTWAVTNSKIARRYEKYKKALFLSLLPVLSLLAIGITYTNFYRPEMNDLLLTILTWI